MKGLLSLLPLLLLGAAPVAPERERPGPTGWSASRTSPPGFRLEPDGRFQYFLIAGALDEQAEGRWSAAGGAVDPDDRAEAGAARVQPGGPSRGPDRRRSPSRSSSPERPRHRRRRSSHRLRRGRAGRRLHAGGRVEPAGGGEADAALDRARGADARLASPRFPIDLAAGNALAFTLVPNDLGVLDFDGVRVESAGAGAGRRARRRPAALRARRRSKT